MPYSSGDLVTVDGIDYTVKAPADAYTVVDSDGNEMVMTMAQLEAGLEEVAEPEEHEMEMEMGGEPMNLKAVKPADRSKVKAALAKAAFGG
jgi:hypothetical protein